MKEQILKDYFENKVSADTLTADLIGAHIITGKQTSSVHVDTIKDDGEFTVTRQHLLKLCNDTINGLLSIENLNTIAFALISSDYFHWDNTTKDGEIVAETIFDWDNPDINFPLTIDNLLLWKKYLETGDYLLKTDKRKKRD